MKTLCRSSLFIFLLTGWLSAPVDAQSATVISDTQAAQHVGQKVTVEGVVVAVFTTGQGSTFIDFGRKYPRQTFTGWIPKDSEFADDSTLAGLVGKKVKISGTIQLYKDKPEIKDHV